MSDFYDPGQKFISKLSQNTILNQTPVSLPWTYRQRKRQTLIMLLRFLRVRGLSVASDTDWTRVSFLFAHNEWERGTGMETQWLLKYWNL